MSSEGEALLAWMNTFPEVQPLNISKFSDLRDGKGIALLWNAVHSNKINVDALGTPNGPEDWLTCFKNFREVDKVISPVLTEKNMREKVDITKISRQGNEEELVKFTSPLVIIAASSPLKREVVTRIKSLSPQNRKVIQTIIQNFAQKKKESSAAKASAATTTPAPKPPSTEIKNPQADQNPQDQTNDQKAPTSANESPSSPPSSQPQKSEEAEPAPSDPQHQQSELQQQQSTQQSQETPKPSEKSENPQTSQPQKNAAQQPMKLENFEILVREAESKIDALKKEIESHDAQLIQLQEQANKKFKKADQSKAQYIDQTERMIADIIKENSENNERLERLRKEDQEAQNELIAMKARVDKSNEIAQKLSTDYQRKRDILDSIKKIEDAINENTYLENQIQQLQAKQSKMNHKKKDKDELNSGLNLDDENDVLSPQEMDEEIEKIKENITTSIMLAEKYGVTSADVQPADNDNHETVSELATRITQMEIELAVINDAVKSGQSGIPPDLLKEQKELSKVIKKLIKRREELENEVKLREQLRQDMRRVQQTMVEQREEVEKELEKLTDDINARNVDLTNWLSFSSSFDAWRGSTTFLTKIRKEFL